jgi:choline-sulfatase
MNKEPGNVVFILSDEHNRNITGCYENHVVETPHIDRLARRGTRFTNAYCNSPICVPARAALATGMHVHETGCWDNAAPYHGQIRSWHHELRDAGYGMVSIGKLHFRSSDDDNGFSDERLPLHVVDGIGDLKGMLRDPLPPKLDAGAMAAEVGAGDTGYGRYDHAIRDDACAWLDQLAREKSDRPFALFVSFIRPHFPLVGPADMYEKYKNHSLEDLRLKVPEHTLTHPVMREMVEFFKYDTFFTDATRTEALRAYYAMVSDLDACIGAVTGALDEAGLSEDTTVIYASDHGDNLGSRGMWGKSVMYEDSVAIPLVVAGPGIAEGHVNKTPVSLLDIHPTMMHVAGRREVGANLPGRSLIDLADKYIPERVVLSQYHAAGSPTGQFMLRSANWKFVYYVGAPPQLFNLEADPHEINDLGEDPACTDICADLERQLRIILDPEAVNRQAFATQAKLIERAGGREAILVQDNIPYTPAPS